MDELTRLVERASHGDDRALVELVRRTQPTVARLCRALCDAIDVDDVVQDAYTRVLRALPAFRFESPVLPWMLSISRRACADAVRRNQRRRRLFERLTSTSTDVALQLDGGDLNEIVRRLDADRRDAFVLTQLLGLSYEEAALTCGCPVGTIRSRVARARADLLATLRRIESA